MKKVLWSLVVIISVFVIFLLHKVNEKNLIISAQYNLIDELEELVGIMEYNADLREEIISKLSN